MLFTCLFFLRLLCRILLSWFRFFDIGSLRIFDVFFLLGLGGLIRISLLFLRLVRLVLSGGGIGLLRIGVFFLNVL